MLKPILLGTFVAGALDIVFAMLLTLASGKSVGSMLRFVASGPFPAARDWGCAGVLLGVGVHFALMAIMACAYVVAARHVRPMLNHLIKSAVIYGLITYIALDLIVVPLRFPGAWPPSLVSVGTQLFAHVVFVGLVVGLITARFSLSPKTKL